MITTDEIVLILFAFCFSGFIKGSLGLGFSTICLAILANSFDLKTAISIALIPSLLSNLIVMYSVGNFKVSVKQFWPMFLATLIGMSLGLSILTQASGSLPKIILGAVLITYGIWGLWNPTYRIGDHLIKKANPPVGFCTGVVNGATGSQIFPIMPYLLSLNISKELFLQTINLSFTLCSIVMLLTLWQIKAVDIPSAINYSFGIIPVAISVWLGGKVRKKLNEKVFRKIIMAIIIALGCSILLKTIIS